jgi:hypothetical protein
MFTCPTHFNHEGVIISNDLPTHAPEELHDLAHMLAVLPVFVDVELKENNARNEGEKEREQKTGVNTPEL